MNEITNILESKEKVEWEGKPKAAPYLIPPIFMSILITVIFVIIFALGKIPWFGIAIVFGIALIIFISSILSYRVAYYMITNKRTIIQSGIIGRDFKSIDYDQVQNVSVNVGLMGVIFKTGSVKIFTGEMESYHTNSSSSINVKGIRVGGSNTGVRAKYDILSQINSPYEIMKLIQEKLSKRKEDLYAGRT